MKQGRAELIQNAFPNLLPRQTMQSIPVPLSLHTLREQIPPGLALLCQRIKVSGSVTQFLEVGCPEAALLEITVIEVGSLGRRVPLGIFVDISIAISFSIFQSTELEPSISIGWAKVHIQKKGFRHLKFNSGGIQAPKSRREIKRPHLAGFAHEKLSMLKFLPVRFSYY